MIAVNNKKIIVGQISEQLNAPNPINTKFPESSRWLFEPLKQDTAIKGERTVDTTIPNKDNWWESLLIVAYDWWEWMSTEKNTEEWNRKLTAYHIEMLDKATALNDTGLVIDQWVIDTCRRFGVKTATIGILTPIEISRDKYGFRENYYNKLPMSERWYKKDGKLAEDPFEAAGATSLQGLIMLESSLEVEPNNPINEHIYMCLNSPYWLNFQARTAVQSLDAGIDAISLDNMIRIPSLHSSGKHTGCFCPFCEQKFCEYLQLKEPGLWKELAAHLKTFSFRTYILNKYFDVNKNPKNVYAGRPDAVYADPVLKHFLLFQTESYLKFFSEYQQRIREHVHSQGKIAPIFGNLYVGVQDHILGVWQPASALLSQYCDMIQIEACPPLPPKYRQSVLYELGAAFGNNEKRVLVIGVLDNGFLGNMEKPLSQRFENIQKISVSQAYSKGSIRELRPPISLNSWRDLVKTGTIDVEKFFPSPDYINFVHNNRKIFLNQIPASKVGIVYSIPSFLWHNYPLFGIHPGQNAKTFIGIARMLEDLHIPYDVLVLGYPGYWNDSNLQARIDDFDLLFFPEVDCLSTEQYRAVRHFIQAGRTAVYTGDFCSKKVNFNPMIDRDTQLLRNNSKRLNVDTTLYTRDRSNSKMSQELRRFREFLTKECGLDIGISVNAPADVELNVYRHKSSNMLIFHLNNYSYNVLNDNVTPHGDLTFKIKWPVTMLIDEISIISPDDVPKGTIQYTVKGNILQFTVPKLYIWNIILLRYHNSNSPK
jgi:hypothetical protein